MALDATTGPFARTTGPEWLPWGYVPIGPDVIIRVTYLRAVKRCSPDQRNTHRKVQCPKAITHNPEWCPEPGLGGNVVQAETSKLIHQLLGASSVGRGSVMCAMSGNPSQTVGSEGLSVRAGRFSVF